MRFWAFPATGSYNGPLYEALSQQGVVAADGIWSISWLLKNVLKEDLIHLHWPSFYYAQEGKKFGSLINFFKFCLCLIFLKLKGARLWWTAHNLLPHDRCEIPILDIAGRHLVILLCEKIFVHGASARLQLEKRFPATQKKNIEIPHGNWVDYYGPQTAKKEARTTLNLPSEKFILLVFGQLRAYKNIHRLVELIKQEHSDDVYLLIAGKFKSEAYENKITQLVSSSSLNIRLDAKFIPNEEVPVYLAASDIMVMPYSEILTSGTAVLAISYGLPVISVKAGFLNEVITPETGVFIQDTTEKSISAAILTSKNRSWDTTDIVGQAKKFTFAEAAKKMAIAFRNT